MIGFIGTFAELQDFAQNSQTSPAIYCESYAAFILAVKEEGVLTSVHVGPTQHENVTNAPATILSRLTSGGKLVFLGVGVNSNEGNITGSLVLGGFVDVNCANGSITCSKPSYNQDAAPLSLNSTKNKKEQVWKLMANDFGDNDYELENDDELLNDEDIAAPAVVPADCGPGAPGDETKKKRACKNCSCGLKEMEEAAVEGEEGEKVVTAPASACGNCAKGDAFRCASCPYLGTSKFASGTKPQISIKEDGSKILLAVGNDI